MPSALTGSRNSSSCATIQVKHQVDGRRLFHPQTFEKTMLRRAGSRRLIDAWNGAPALSSVCASVCRPSAHVVECGPPSPTLRFTPYRLLSPLSIALTMELLEVCVFDPMDCRMPPTRTTGVREDRPRADSHQKIMSWSVRKDIRGAKERKTGHRRYNQLIFICLPVS